MIRYSIKSTDARTFPLSPCCSDLKQTELPPRRHPRGLGQDGPILQHDADLPVLGDEPHEVGVQLPAIGTLVVEELDDRDYLSTLVRATCSELPTPKTKKKRGRKEA